jgi:pimeloyl-ACP methyl ester carboxylesterase
MPQITVNGYRLRYERIGHGSQLWLVFGGYGQDISSWAPHMQSMLETHSCICVELPGHTFLTHLRGEPLTQNHWQLIIESLCRKENLTSISVFGFSLGGRLALATLLALKGRVERVVLVAVEGLTSSPVYNLATGSTRGKALLKSIVIHPESLRPLFRFARTIRFLTPSGERLIRFALGTRKRRLQLYYSWLTLAQLPNTPEKGWSHFCKSFGITAHYIYAEGDYIHPQKKALLSISRMGIPAQRVSVLECSHTQLPFQAITQMATFTSLKS